MLEIFAIILLLTLISKFIEDALRIPFVLIVIILSYSFNNFFELSILKNNFENIIYLMLPIILIPDVLGLSRSELRENLGNIFYLAVVAVILSIIIAVGFTYYIDDFYHLSIFHLMILFTPLMATDVVSVSAIFSKFKLPEKLKLYAEGESLFNDITAMVIFFFIAIPFLNGEELTLHNLANITIYTISLSVVIGIVVGLLGYYSFKFSRDMFEEFISIYVMASLSFLISDELELSGILAVVISIMFFKYLFDKEGHYKKQNYAAILMHFNSKSSSSTSFRAYQKESHYLGLFANAIIFITIAYVIDMQLLFKYKYEILYTFVLTSIIRYFVVFLFIKYRKLPLRWSNILSLSGMKGGLALIMIVSLNDDFVYKEMFLAVVVGVVILSIFVYTLLLMVYLYFQKDNLIMDKAAEHKMVFTDLKELLEKEASTGAYNEVIFEDLIEKEIDRAQRHNDQFSLVSLSTDEKTLKKIADTLIRKSDYFGKIDEKYYAVLLTNSSVDGAFIFAEKLQKLVLKQHIAIAQYMPGDSKEMLYNKLNTALQNNQKEINIEI